MSEIIKRSVRSVHASHKHQPLDNLFEIWFKQDVCMPNLAPHNINAMYSRSKQSTCLRRLSLLLLGQARPCPKQCQHALQKSRITKVSYMMIYFQYAEALKLLAIPDQIYRQLPCVPWPPGTCMKCKLLEHFTCVCILQLCSLTAFLGVLMHFVMLRLTLKSCRRLVAATVIDTEL